MRTGLAQEPEVTEEATETPEMTEIPEVTDIPDEETPEVTHIPGEETPEASDDGFVYIVKIGDNLYRIALRFGMTMQELADANGITNPSLIYVGQRIIIPGQVTPPGSETPSPEPPPAETQAPPGTNVSYVVQAGDTLFRIAIRHNTTVNVLLNLNPQIANSSLIFVGQRINLPEATTSSSSDASEDETHLDLSVAQGIEVFLGADVDIEALVSETTQLKVLWVKITVNWAEIEPEQGSFVFGQLDTAIAAFDEAGFDLIVTLTGAPEWSRPGATELALQQPTYGPPDNLADFGAFAGAIAEHYVGVVDAYEVWYQPNNRLSWMIPDVELRSDGYPDARLSNVRYIDLLKIASTAIHSADPDALVITAGLAPTGINDFYNSIDNFVFFEEMLKQGALDFADIVGIHIDGFSNAPDTECCAAVSDSTEQQFNTSEHFFFLDTLNNYRTILDRNGGSDIPLWVTRVGWGTAENSPNIPPAELAFVNLNSAEEQANYVATAFELANQRGDIGPMIFYNLNACTVREVEACYYSAIDANGSARPVFNALSNLNLDKASDSSNN
jgi:LysM repeat protein